MSKDEEKPYLAYATVTGRGAITLPKKVQEKLGLQRGDIVLFIEKGNETCIRKGILTAK